MNTVAQFIKPVQQERADFRKVSLNNPPKRKKNELSNSIRNGPGNSIVVNVIDGSTSVESR